MIQHLIKVFPSFLHPLCPMWVQSGTFICSIIVLNSNISFNFCARFDFNFIWFIQCLKLRKLKTEIISIQHNLQTQCTIKFLYYVIQRVQKLFVLNLVLTHSLNFFIVKKKNHCVVTMQLIYVSMAIMQVTTSVAFWQVFRCYFLLLACWWIFL